MEAQKLLKGRAENFIGDRDVYLKTLCKNYLMEVQKVLKGGAENFVSDRDILPQNPVQKLLNGGAEIDLTKCRKRRARITDQLLKPRP